MIAKILNLKGYHNFRNAVTCPIGAVCDSKDTKFERISQPACKIGHFFGAVCASKDTSHDGHSLRLPG